METPKRRVALLLDFESFWERDYLEGVERYLRKAGRPWRIYTEQGDVGLPISGLHRWRGDGVIGFLRDRKLAQFIQRAGIPAVNSSWEGLQLGLTCVVPDRHGQGVVAAEYFLRRGFRHYAWVRHRRTFTPMEQGFGDRLRQEGLDYTIVYHPLRLSQSRPWRYYHSKLTDWLRPLPKPLALACVSDIQAARILTACAAEGIRVPEEVAVLGRGDDIICRYTNPPMSSVNRNYDGVGSTAAELLEALMSGQEAPTEPILVTDTSIVERQSTNTMAIEDPRLAGIVDYVAEHACDPITVKDLVVRFGVNRRTLQRLFLRNLHCSPNSEIARVRIGRARRLLTETDLPVGKVAKACGFSGTVSLSIAFRREAGLSPGRFRKRLVGQEREAEVS
ncbi:MAG: DNA-binding transcriptional regulator [Phycisphaerae bacterium]|nr:DNA-binding transcriptional regulator [Phycisphaerae bacterium]